MSIVIRLSLEYDGSRFHGWQVQPNRRTVQGVLEKAVASLTSRRTRVTAAGRTDAGVHALYQVAHFRTTVSRPPDEWRRALNALLPQDVCVTSCAVATPGFHARRSAREKIYEYTIWNRPVRSPFEVRRAWHIGRPLNLPAMRRAARHLVGRHDFTSFASSRSEARSAICTIQEIAITKEGDRIIVRIRGDRFVMHMVRNIVGTLVEVGLGRRLAAEIPPLLAVRSRSNAGRAAPPHGLCLVQVRLRERTRQKIA